MSEVAGAFTMVKAEDESLQQALEAAMVQAVYLALQDGIDPHDGAEIVKRKLAARDAVLAAYEAEAQ